MKKIFFYKNQLINKNEYYCDWIFRDEFIFSKYNFLNYKNKDIRKKIKLSEFYQEKLFHDIFDKLNKYNNLNYTDRQWKLLLNRTVKFYVDTVIFRYFYLIDLIENYKIKYFYFSFNKKKQIIPISLINLFENLDDNEKDNYLTYKIANYLKKKYKIKLFVNNKNVKDKKSDIDDYYKFDIYKSKILSFANFFLKYTLKKNTPIILTTYLPRFSEIKFQINNSSYFFWKNFFFKKNFELIEILKKEKNTKRKKIFFTKSNDDFYQFLLNLFHEYLPSCYLENFNKFDNFVNKNQIVKNPKFIFTSNEFLFNEFFKLFLVKKLKNKETKYYVGQHGGTYGTMLEQRNTIEEVTSDKFITWGWKYKKNHLPFGVINTVGKKIFKPTKPNKLIIINANLDNANSVYNCTAEYLNRLNNIENILIKLIKSILKKTTIRFHHHEKKFEKFLEKKFEIFNGISLDFSNKNINNYYDNKSLLVYTYLSSGFFENISLNLRSFIILGNNREIDFNFNNYLKFLIKKKYIFKDVKKLTNHINNLFLNEKYKQNKFLGIKLKLKYARYKKKFIPSFQNESI